jgi:methionyl-tRNA formyltransferase
MGSYSSEIGVPVEEIDDINAPEWLEWLTETQPDLIAVVAFGQKLGPAVRSLPSWGCLNIHPSLLPRWRGAAPVQAAVLEGDEKTGVCIIDVVERMDAGDVLACHVTPVGRKNAGDLLEELSGTGARLLVETLDSLARDQIERTTQDESAVTRARKLKADDGRIRWEYDAVDVDRRVRACTPRPGAYTGLPDGTRLTILAGDPESTARGPLPGEILDGEGLVVACGQGAFRITRLQRSGKRPLDAAEFLRGQSLSPGMRFGP